MADPFAPPPSYAAPRHAARSGRTARSHHAAGVHAKPAKRAHVAPHPKHVSPTHHAKHAATAHHAKHAAAAKHAKHAAAKHHVARAKHAKPAGHRSRTRKK
jgi:hypothetical protein